MDASAVFCLIIYRVSTVQTTNQFLFMMTAAVDSFRMLIFISVFPSCGLDGWLRRHFVIANFQGKDIGAIHCCAQGSQRYKDRLNKQTKKIEFILNI